MLQKRKNLRACFFVNAVVLFGAVNKLLLHGIQLFGFLFAHGAAQNIGLAKRKACQYGSYLHYLFLIQNNAESIF